MTPERAAELADEMRRASEAWVRDYRAPGGRQRYQRDLWRRTELMFGIRLRRPVVTRAPVRTIRSRGIRSHAPRPSASASSSSDGDGPADPGDPPGYTVSYSCTAPRADSRARVVELLARLIGGES